MTSSGKILLVWQPHGGQYGEDARPLAQFILQEAIRVAAETDECFTRDSPMAGGITRDEFTTIVNETLYAFIAWTDVLAFSMLGPARRGDFLDSIAFELQSFLIDEQLAFHPKYLPRREIEPGIWIAGLDEKDLNRRQLEYARHFDPDLDLPAVITHLRGQVGAFSLAVCRPEVGDELEAAVGKRLSTVFEEMRAALKSIPSRRLTGA